MYNYGFENYKKYKILDKNKFNIDSTYYPDRVYIKEDFFYPLTESEKEEVKVLVKLTKLSNYKNNDDVGSVSVSIGKEEIYNEKVYVTTKKHENKNIFIRLWSWLFD